MSVLDKTGEILSYIETLTNNINVLVDNRESLTRKVEGYNSDGNISKLELIEFQINMYKHVIQGLSSLLQSVLNEQIDKYLKRCERDIYFQQEDPNQYIYSTTGTSDEDFKDENTIESIEERWDEDQQIDYDINK